MEWLTVFTVSSIPLVALYYYLTSTFNFWSKRGVPGPKPLPLIGTFKDLLLAKLSLGDCLTKIYNVYVDQPLVGLFQGRSPVLLVRDPELIKDILIKDFSKFADRGLDVYEKIEPLTQHLFALEPARWRPLRSKLSPIFTSGKLKDMFYLLLECADHLVEFLDQLVEKSPVLECRDLTAKYTTDVIGVCAFGLKMNAIAEEDSEFRRMGRKIFQPSWKSFVRFRLRELSSWLYQLCGSFFYDHELNDFFIKSMKETMELRRKSNVRRKDFVDLMLDLKDHPDKVGDFELTDIIITAQAFVFFFAGFETSSSTISNALYELALNPKIQDKLREEIVEKLKDSGGELKYETLKSMPYLHKVFSETLRKYPVLPALRRKSMEPYEFSSVKVRIPKGTVVLIPVYGIQRDPQIYPEPDKFDPERFTDEMVQQRHPSYYLPFGDGPRNCIGARFGVNQTKVGLVSILKNYKVDVCSETCMPYVNDPRAFLLAPVGGIKLKFTKVPK